MAKNLRSTLLKRLLDDAALKKPLPMKIGDDIEIDSVKFKFVDDEKLGPVLRRDPTAPKPDEDIALNSFVTDYVNPRPDFDATNNRISFAESRTAWNTRLNDLANELNLDANQKKVFINDQTKRFESTPMYKAYEVQNKVESALKKASVKNPPQGKVDDVKNAIKGLFDKQNAGTPLTPDDLKLLASKTDDLATALGQPKILKKSVAELKDFTKAVEDAATKGKISPLVKKILIGTTGLVGTAALIGAGIGLGRNFPYEATLAEAAEQHQKDLNGCWYYDYGKDGARTKVKLLTCGNADVSSATETCATQNYAATSAAVSACPSGTFNPCAKDSRSRASGTSVPLVPNVCDYYLYNGDQPTAVQGVTTKDACKMPDGKALDSRAVCSPYCKSSNFNLEKNTDLFCVQVDYPTALLDLLVNLGVDPNNVVDPDANAGATSKTLKIVAGVLGGIFVLLLIVYLLK